MAVKKQSVLGASGTTNQTSGFAMDPTGAGESGSKAEAPTGASFTSLPVSNPIKSTSPLKVAQPHITDTPSKVPGSGTPPSVNNPNPTPAAAAPPSGAPDPGTPNTTATIPLIATDESAKTGAATTYNDTVNSLNQGMGTAAFAYGDPTAMQQFNVGTVNPNSALAIAALNAQNANQANGNNMEENNTNFSSLNQQNQQKIADAESRAQLAGKTRYQTALGKFNLAIQAAADARDQTINNANADERTQYLNNLPTTAPATNNAAVASTPAPATPAAAPAPTAKPEIGVAKAAPPKGSIVMSPAKGGSSMSSIENLFKKAK